MDPSSIGTYAVIRPVRGSDIPVELAFAPTRDEIYVPVAIRRPPGKGPFPVNHDGQRQRPGRDCPY